MTAMGGMGTSDMFMNGTAAMFFTGIWKVPQLRSITAFEWDVAPFPSGPQGKMAFSMSAAGYGILKTSKHPDLDYELVKFLAGESGQRAMARTGLAQPAMRTIAASSDFLDGQVPASKNFLLDCIQNGVFRPFDIHAEEWLYSVVGPKLDRVWNGETTAEQAMKQAVSEVNKKYYPEKK
jgi:ABC-type glycerol-3-phosphate transport system substrate-binding protein